MRYVLNDAGRHRSVRSYAHNNTATSDTLPGSTHANIDSSDCVYNVAPVFVSAFRRIPPTSVYSLYLVRVLWPNYRVYGSRLCIFNVSSICCSRNRSVREPRLVHHTHADSRLTFPPIITEPTSHHSISRSGFLSHFLQVASRSTSSSWGDTDVTRTSPSRYSSIDLALPQAVQVRHVDSEPPSVKSQHHGARCPLVSGGHLFLQTSDSPLAGFGILPLRLSQSFPSSLV